MHSYTSASLAPHNLISSTYILQAQRGLSNDGTASPHSTKQRIQTTLQKLTALREQQSIAHPFWIVAAPVTQVRAFAVQSMLFCSCHLPNPPNRLDAFAGMLYHTGTNSFCVCHLMVCCKMQTKPKPGQNLTIIHHNLWLHATYTQCLHHDAICHGLMWENKNNFKVQDQFAPLRYVRSAACNDRGLLPSSGA